MHIGKSIRALRELQGMKQETLGQILKISQQTVSKIEQSANMPDRSVERIASALGVPAWAIYEYDDQKVVTAVTTRSVNIEPAVSNANCQFCPMAKIIDLYERLLEAACKK